MRKSKPKPDAADEPDAGAVRGAALTLLARREHSRRELQRKLLARDFPPLLIDEVLDDLVHRRMLDEERFAREYVRVRASRGYGPVRIEAELHERGVPEGLIDCVLGDYADGWAEQVAQVYSKRFGAEVTIEYRERARRARFLQQRGFSPEQIRTLFKELD